MLVKNLFSILTEETLFFCRTDKHEGARLRVCVSILVTNRDQPGRYQCLDTNIVTCRSETGSMVTASNNHINFQPRLVNTNQNYSLLFFSYSFKFLWSMSSFCLIHQGYREPNCCTEQELVTPFNKKYSQFGKCNKWFRNACSVILKIWCFAGYQLNFVKISWLFLVRIIDQSIGVTINIFYVCKFLFH